jgi:hypothetical protein
MRANQSIFGIGLNTPRSHRDTVPTSTSALRLVAVKRYLEIADESTPLPSMYRETPIRTNRALRRT